MVQTTLMSKLHSTIKQVHHQKKKISMTLYETSHNHNILPVSWTFQWKPIFSIIPVNLSVVITHNYETKHLKRLQSLLEGFPSIHLNDKA